MLKTSEQRSVQCSVQSVFRIVLNFRTVFRAVFRTVFRTVLRAVLNFRTVFRTVLVDFPSNKHLIQKVPFHDFSEFLVPHPGRASSEGGGCFLTGGRC